MTDAWGKEEEHVQSRVPVSQYRPFHPVSDVKRSRPMNPDERSRRASPAKLIRFSRNVIASFARSQGGDFEAVSVSFLPQFPDQLAVPSSDQ